MLRTYPNNTIPNIFQITRSLFFSNHFDWDCWVYQLLMYSIEILKWDRFTFSWILLWKILLYMNTFLVSLTASSAPSDVICRISIIQIIIFNLVALGRQNCTQWVYGRWMGGRTYERDPLEVRVLLTSTFKIEILLTSIKF